MDWFIILWNFLTSDPLAIAGETFIGLSIASFAVRKYLKYRGIKNDPLVAAIDLDVAVAKETIDTLVNERINKAVKPVSITTPCACVNHQAVKILQPNQDQKESETKPEDPKPIEEADPKTPIIPIIILLLLIPILSACSLLTSAGSYLVDNVEITWKQDKASLVSMPIDSIVVKFDPAYWKEDYVSRDSNYAEQEKDMVINNYEVWQLKTPNWRRFEVRRQDTIIYIYKTIKQ